MIPKVGGREQNLGPSAGKGQVGPEVKRIAEEVA